MVLVQIHTTFHIVKDKYIFCQLIVLQTLISAISPGDIHARYVGEKLRGNFLGIILIWFC